VGNLVIQELKQNFCLFLIIQRSTFSLCLPVLNSSCKTRLTLKWIQKRR
jgi:hypothetical protein